MQNHQLINQTSGEFEYYTDPRIVEAARAVMGSIDLDPASSVKANQLVKAKRWFGYDPSGYFVDGLFQNWEWDNLWMNHPFGRQEEACKEECQKHLENPKHRHHSIVWHGNKAWIDKYVREFREKHFTQALNITYAATSEGWFQPLMQFPNCFLTPRTNYYLPDGTIKQGVTKGSVVTYLGSNLQQFVTEFAPFGTIKVKA